MKVSLTHGRKYRVDRAIYGDGRVVYEVYYMELAILYSNGLPSMRKRVASEWASLSLAKANRDHLQKEYLANKVISRKEVL